MCYVYQADSLCEVSGVCLMCVRLDLLCEVHGVCYVCEA